MIRIGLKWESAPVNSKWQEALCKKIDTRQTACTDAILEALAEITACQATAAALKERKAKDNPAS